MEDCRRRRDEKTADALTPAAEEYLEMIYRLSLDGEGESDEKPVRICSLAEKLQVSPSSASRMAQSMALWGYLDFKRYGYITMTEKGKKTGGYFVRRHRTVTEFFAWLCGGECRDDTDRIVHFITPSTVDAMEKQLGENSQPCDCPEKITAAESMEQEKEQDG